MKIYKLEVLIIDEDVSSREDAIDLINDTQYPNHTNVEAVTCSEADIGEWHDDHPLNYKDKTLAEMDRLFPVQDKPKFPSLESYKCDLCGEVILATDNHICEC
jgi:hypothetical protein